MCELESVHEWMGGGGGWGAVVCTRTHSVCFKYVIAVCKSAQRDAVSNMLYQTHCTNV